MADSKYKVISLFSGGMGLDIGLEQAGLEISIGQDYEPNCVATMQANGHAILAGDIRNIDPHVLLDMTDMEKEEPFLLCGGPPCQPFSTAGKRMGINDPRGSLFMDFVRMIDYIRPRFFVMENVKGLMSARLRDADGKLLDGRVLDVVLGEFKRLKYKTVYGLLDAVNYGVPEFRERFILIGSRDHEDIFLPTPTHFQRHQLAEYRWRVLKDAIINLNEANPECVSIGEERLKYLRMVPEGGNWRDLPKNLVKEAMGGAYESGGGKVGFYRRLSFNQPSPTLTTAPGQKATMLCHPTEDRVLSVREYARIQQFPDGWIFCGSTADKYRQIGNAVPVGLARAIGQAIIATVEGTSLIETKRTRGTAVHNKISQALVLGGEK